MMHMSIYMFGGVVWKEVGLSLLRQGNALIELLVSFHYEFPNRLIDLNALNPPCLQRTNDNNPQSL